MSDTIEIYFEGSFNLTREEVEEAGGNFSQAVQNAIGHTGARADNAQDEFDNYTLKQHDESVAACN